MVRIVTDSPADFEPWELKEKKITCIPLKVLLEGQEYEENINLSKPEFYTLLSGTEEFPKSSQPSPKWFRDIIKEAKAAGDEVVYITLSSGISGTYQTAVMTAEDLEYEGCHVFDSLNATAGQRMLVQTAVDLRDAGKSAAEIVTELNRLRDKVVLYACIDTLEYLYRGGRISQTAYKLGTMAQVKPLIRFSAEGTIEVPAKAMGTRKGMDMVCKKLETTKMNPSYPLYVMYSADKAVGETLAEKVRSLGYAVREEDIVPVGAAIGCHIGPNACGIVYIAED